MKNLHGDWIFDLIARLFHTKLAKEMGIVELGKAKGSRSFQRAATSSDMRIGK